jgi:hypothetical protein
MSDGDLYMTVTVEGATVPVLVSNPKQGRALDDRSGSTPRSRGESAQERQGTDAQETTGSSPKGTNGRVI